MRYVCRKLALALMAVVVVSAVAAVSAFAALPAFEKPFPNKFEVKGPGVGLETVGKRSIVNCSILGKLSGTGEITGAKALTATFQLTGCFGVGFKKCSTAGAKEGEIKLELEGTPVYVDKAVGVLLKHKGGGNFVEYTCGSTEKETVKVRGSVIGTISFANVTGKQFRLIFSEKQGVQEPSEYIGEKGEKIKAFLEAEGSGKEVFGFEQVGLTETASHFNELTTTAATQIIAVLASRGLPELRPEPWGSFTGIVLGGTEFNVVGYGRWVYGHATVEGSIIDPNEVALTVTFSEPSGGGCLGRTITLIGRLGYVNKATKEVGLLLEPVFPVWFKCNPPTGAEQEYTGSVIGRITPVRKPFNKILKLAIQNEGKEKQAIEKFEGEEVLHHLTVFYLSNRREATGASMAAEFELTFPVSVEIEA
jgi:hypothetical protein